MQLAAFSARIAVSPKRIREWVRLKVVLPAGGTGGRGHPFEYDEANLVTGAVAERLGRLHVVVAHYGPAFADLHDKLRATSSLEWGRFHLEMTPTSAELREPGSEAGISNALIRLDLSPLCTNLMLSEPQQPLPFGLRSVM